MADRNMNEQRGVVIQQTREGMMLLVPPSDLFVTGAPTPRAINPFRTTTNQEFPLGTKLIYGDRAFVYAKAGAVALAVGKLMQAVVPLAGHIDEVVNSPAAGSTTIAFTPNTLTTDDLAANELADGYILINDDTGEGYLYRIKSHPAILGATSGTLTLYDPIELTLGDNATATVFRNRYRNVILHPSPPTALLAGVTVAAVAASEYCWLQQKGPCPVLTQGTLVIADLCVPSATVDGAVMPSAAIETDGPVVGHVFAVNADTEYSCIWLDIP